MGDYKENKFYWIKIDERWEPAQYNRNGYWHLLGADWEWHTSELEEIGNEIIMNE